MSKRQTHEDGPSILTDGAEIHFTNDRDVKRADRVEFLRGGWVKAIYKEGYQLEMYPPRVIHGVYTHTLRPHKGPSETSSGFAPCFQLLFQENG